MAKKADFVTIDDLEQEMIKVGIMLTEKTQSRAPLSALECENLRCLTELYKAVKSVSF